MENRKGAKFTIEQKGPDNIEKIPLLMTVDKQIGCTYPHNVARTKPNISQGSISSVLHSSLLIHQFKFN